MKQRLITKIRRFGKCKTNSKVERIHTKPSKRNERTQETSLNEMKPDIKKPKTKHTNPNKSKRQCQRNINELV